MTRETQKTLEKMIEFLREDIKNEEDLLKRYGNTMSWFMRFKIRRQIVKTKNQIKHYRDIIDRYDREGWI